MERYGDSVIIVAKGASRFGASEIMKQHNNKIPVWTLNNGFFAPMSEVENLHFEVHDPIHHTEEEILNNFRTNVPYFREEQLTIITRGKLPVDEIINEFKVTFLTNCVCYQIALAVLLGYKTIYLCGVDTFIMEKTREQEILGVEFWIGVAKGRGITVKQTQGLTNLFKNPTEFKLRNYLNGKNIGQNIRVDDKYLYDTKYLYK